MQFQPVDILLEADEDQAQAFVASLREGKLQATLRVACNDAEVLASLRGAALPDVVVLNPSLPGGDALGVMRQIRSDPRLRKIPVVMLADPAPPTPADGDEAAPDAAARPPPRLLAVDVFAMVRSMDEFGFCITTRADG
jgi:CheY-like chemotaxis protein